MFQNHFPGPRVSLTHIWASAVFLKWSHASKWLDLNSVVVDNLALLSAQVKEGLLLLQMKRIPIGDENVPNEARFDLRFCGRVALSSPLHNLDKGNSHVLIC